MKNLPEAWDAGTSQAPFIVVVAIMLLVLLYGGG